MKDGQLTEEEFRAEKLYYVSRAIAKTVLDKGIIDEGLFAAIDRELLETYRPVMGTLLAGKSLT